VIYLDFLWIFIDFLIMLCYLEINEAANKKNDVPPFLVPIIKGKPFCRFTEVWHRSSAVASKKEVLKE